MELSYSVKIAILFSGIFLWIGMATGVWKYLQMKKSNETRAHYYVDVAHRSSLLYAPAALILGVLAYFSIWNEALNMAAVLVNIIFFSASIAAYILHGFLQDTKNQFQQPHRLGRYHLPNWMMQLFMWGLILAELGGTTVLLLGAYLALF
jgi:cytochrome bd-type quinol oxidase subunit 2